MTDFAAIMPYPADVVDPNWLVSRNRDTWRKSRSAAPGWQGVTSENAGVFERGATPPGGCPPRSYATNHGYGTLGRRRYALFPLRTGGRRHGASHSLDQHRVAELVRPVAPRVERGIRLGQRAIVQKRAQYLVVAAAGFVRAGEQGVDDPQPADPARCAGPRSPLPDGQPRRARRRARAHARPWCRPRRSAGPPPGRWRSRPPWLPGCDTARRTGSR